MDMRVDIARTPFIYIVDIIMGDIVVVTVKLFSDNLAHGNGTGDCG
jgi:hypothetical protein